MQITPINNTSFNGRFKNTPSLNYMLSYADKETLTRFNAVVKRAKNVNDKKVFSFKHHIYNDIEKFSLYSQKDNVTVLEKELAQKYEEDLFVFDKYEKYSKVLKPFISLLESKYSKEQTRSQIIEDIMKDLV